MSFDARLRLPGSRLPLGVEVDILHERMTVTSGERTVAQWPLERLEVTRRPDGFHIKVDGEELVLAVSDPNGFAKAVGVSATPARDTLPPSGRIAALADTSRPMVGSSRNSRRGACSRLATISQRMRSPSDS